MRSRTMAIVAAGLGLVVWLGLHVELRPQDVRIASVARADVPAQAPPAAPSSSRPSKVQYSDHAMGTNVTVWLWTADERAAAQAAEAVFTEMKRLDKEMTTWDPASEVSQINTAAGTKPVQVSDETYAVIERAVDVSRRSRGLFDITVEAFK